MVINAGAEQSRDLRTTLAQCVTCLSLLSKRFAFKKVIFDRNAAFFRRQSVEKCSNYLSIGVFITPPLMKVVNLTKPSAPLVRAVLANRLTAAWDRAPSCWAQEGKESDAPLWDTLFNITEAVSQ
jgi:hypothetical protein